jgi:parvulin-like peptidyl-prolyl isomerase
MKYWKLFRHFLNAICLGSLLLIPTSGFPATVDRIVAKVNKEIITLSELKERVFLKIMNFRKMKVHPMPSKEQVMREELDAMIMEKLLVDAGQKRGYKVDDKRVNSAIRDIEQLNQLKEGELELMLRAEGKSMDEYTQKIRDQIMMSDIRGYEIRKRIAVSEEEIQGYYNQNLKKYWIPAKLKLRHILFLMGDELLEDHKKIKRDKAQQALKKIRSGEDFASVAREFSEDVSASSGGDLGELERGKMVPEFEKAAFNLKEGEVSGLVETPYGLHIIKVDKITPGATLALDEVRDEIKSLFVKNKSEQEFREFMDELKENAFVQNKLFANPPMPPGPGKEVFAEASGDQMRSVRQGNPDDDRLPMSSTAESTPFAESPEYSRFKSFEEKLRYYKNLRDSRKISEEDYHKKKQELLNHL